MEMNTKALRQLWQQEEAAAFEGWDFSRLIGRWQESALPWDYRSLVLEALSPQARLLDMGTGGGEFLLTLGHPPRLTSVTEGYPPNLALCRRRLAPLGITVCPAGEDDALPFGDSAFDLIINRHESFIAAEVFRVLKPGSKFITQQVGGLNNLELNQVLEDAVSFPYVKYSLTEAFTELINAGFKIERAQQAAQISDRGNGLFPLRPGLIPGCPVRLPAG